MKKKVLFLILCLQFIGLTVFSQVNLDSGLVAKYYFNGNANDESIYANNGTVYGATLTEDRDGNQNSAYEFNGTTDYIKVPNSSSLNILNSISICAWFKTADPDIYPDANGGFLVSKAYTNGSRAYTLVANDSTLGDSIVFQLFDNNNIQHRTSKYSSYYVNKWQFLVATYNYTTGITNIYINGLLVTTKSVGQFNIKQTTVPLSIGCFWNDINGNTQRGLYKGCIDDIKIYNRAINQAEVTALYNEVITSSKTNINSLNKISIYPNPTNTFITIDIKNTNASFVEIIDFSGNTVIKEKLKNSLDISNLTCGIYIVKVLDKKGTVLKSDKIVKK